jgi:copper chaperone CopZ
MLRLSRLALIALVVVSLVRAIDARAASPITYTTIYVHDMHCADCAKQIARKLYAIPGVVEVRADVSKNVAFVVPQKEKTLSARSLWDAVESAGFKVARLESPQGTFTARPTR